MTHSGQRQRILDRLKQGGEVSALDLHRIGSGKPHGFVASLSRRVADIRDMGFTVICRRETINGQVHTFYTMLTEAQEKLFQTVADAFCEEQP